MQIENIILLDKRFVKTSETDVLTSGNNIYITLDGLVPNTWSAFGIIHGTGLWSPYFANKTSPV